MIVWLVCCVTSLVSAQRQNSDQVAASADAGQPVIRVQSKLAVVRAMVEDKKVWRNGPGLRGERCALAAEQKVYRLPATEPYIPTDCEELFIRGLTAKDFHLLVDGVEQRIQSVSSESDGVRVRDNLGVHNEYSQTPTGKWSTRDRDNSSPRYIQGDYGLQARNRYDLSFVPGSSRSTGCHKIEVKVDRQNSIVAARDEYCDSESPSDILNGSTFGNQLEQYLTSGRPGRIPLSLQAAAFDTDKGGQARIALEFPVDSLHRQWRQDWTLDATIAVLGMVYRRDGSLATRFSDFACCTPYSTAFVFGTRGLTVNGFTGLIKQSGSSSGLVSMYLSSVEHGILPTRYETSLNVPPGEYDLRIVLSDGESFGRAEKHVKIESHDREGLSLSSIILCNRYRDAHVAGVETSVANFVPQYVPMVSKGIHLAPAGDSDFKTGEPLIPYFEIYRREADGTSTTQIQVHLRIIDANNGRTVKDFPAVDAGPYVQPGRTIIPIAREVPVAELPRGEYRLEVQASDSAGRNTPWRASNFTITGNK